MSCQIEKLNFQEYFYLSEALKFEKGGFSIEADDKEKGITLAQIFKDIKDNRSAILNKIKQSIKSHHFSPLVIAASLALAGINTQKFIDQNPEVLNYGLSQNVANKAAQILNFFQK